ncbi:MAG TPA: glycosyltransferase family 39 protein, partial [Thermoanaerobaculia bacterium]
FARVAEGWPATKDTVWAQWLLAEAIIYAVRDEVAGAPTTRLLPRSAFLNDSEAMFRRARIALLLITGLGLAAIIFAWSRELWGSAGAALSTALFCFDPNFIAHCGLVTTDAGVSLFMTASVYFFWRATRRRSLFNISGFAIFTALAAVTKFSSLLLAIIIPVLAIVAVRQRAIGVAHLFAIVLAALAVTVTVIWSVFEFRFDATHGLLPIRSLAKPGVFGSSLLFANDHRLLPQPYLFGLARMRADVARPSYLRGAKLEHPSRTYFLWTFLTKTPLPAIAAIVAALVVAIRKRPIGLAYLLIPAAIYFVVAIAAGLNIGHRHLLPMYPLLYVLCGILSVRWLIACVLSLVSCLVVFTPWDPMWGHHLSYFNELARGPRHGWEIVSDSNVDWGQDLPRLATWLRSHRVDEPVNFVYFGSADPQYYGIRYVNVGGGYVAADAVPADQVRAPGWLVISVTQYSGAAAPTAATWRVFAADHHARLVGRAGYSILIFRIDR